MNQFLFLKYASHERFGQYQLAIWPIPVGDFANNGEGTFLEDLGRFEVEIKDSKNMEGLRIIPRYGIKNKKKIDLATEESL